MYSSDTCLEMDENAIPKLLSGYKKRTSLSYYYSVDNSTEFDKLSCATHADSIETYYLSTLCTNLPLDASLNCNDQHNVYGKYGLPIDIYYGQ